MQNFCTSNGWIVDSVVKEVGSGLNDERKKLLSIFKDPQVKRIVVEHQDRLTRFGFNYLQTFAEIEGFEIVVADKTMDNDKDDIMVDFTAIITSFCARLYSKRRGKNKTDALNRQSQAKFKCQCCGHTCNADVNAALNILQRRSLKISLSNGSDKRKTLKDRLLDAHSNMCPSGKHLSMVSL